MASERAGGGTEVNTGIPIARASEVPRITAIAGPGAGRVVVMSHAIATVGRHPTNDLVLDDARVSGVHLQLTRAHDRVKVRDAGTTNGTWLGAHRITEIELAPGAEIVVGDTTLRVETEESPSLAAVSQNESFGGLVGRSTAMREIFATLDRVSKKHLNLLFQGEAGTGKEEMARAIVAHSPHAQAPFVVVDITSLPNAMIESVLFGSEKTASAERTAGLFESAHGGTVFIDEVGELPPPVQSKLLRLLERQESIPVGGHAPTKVDVRILGATTRDLRHEIELGRFREDLYFRLAQIRIFVPSLRDRTEDIPILCQTLLAKISGAVPLAIEPEAVEQLAAHGWPGNVRELRNALERACAFAQGNTIRRADIAGEGFGFRGTREERSALDLSGTFRIAKDRAIERFESAYLSALMRRCNGNLSLASREAELARHHLRDVLKKRELYGVAWEKVDD